MKFSTVAAAALATAVASVSAANFTISEPWGETTWTAGQTGVVAWSASTDLLQSFCEIHLLTGNATDATFVTNFTANGNLVPCNYTKANLHPLPDYASGQYFIRIGPNGAVTDQYAYSGLFNYVGNGTVLPDGETPATTTAAAAPAVTDAATEQSA
ncbi:hypothetical protein V8B55DRAFT_1395526 [Mucor lusitanicus]|uniref:Yeast cell wall synthesis Kre9/Knh1-like N-terminal domain-containing protein n=2 Tax=Mucor circinelloides f. lusitanicus TaxID=29924 RepID=A0A162R0E7_MUCCL|nr:hypothetical protein FB192DRAFT_1397871 [Mucor lusitanicus]OAD07100.1 hypothetical protein MUCCIDRAFT_155474 [Mucor lusitanicus CBS 277.49]